MRAPALAVLILMLAAPAVADVPQPLPTDCAPGSIPRSSREGAWCEPTTCESDVDCPAYEYCATERSPCPSPERYRCSDEPLGLCVVTGALPVTSGACRTAADCTTPGARCEPVRRCEHTPERSIGGMCGCRVRRGDGPGSALLVVGGLLLGLRRRPRSNP